MKEMHYDFVEIDSTQSFQSFGRTFGGVLKNDTLFFDNEIAKGQLKKIDLEDGLWVRIWKLTTYHRITLHRLPAPIEHEKKFSLVYFLNPSLFQLKHTQKKVRVNSQHNIMFLPNDVTTDFFVVPIHPFYVLDITFTSSWLSQQLGEADSCVDSTLYDRINNAEQLLAHCCNADEYQTLHELETSVMAEQKDSLFIRSRIYKLICSFISKIGGQNEMEHAKRTVHYDQMISVKKIIQENLAALPSIAAIASDVNLSVSTLMRQFKSMYGKSIHAYHVEKRTEFAKKMLVEGKMNVKEIAAMLGYTQASPFIEAFKKTHGFSPGSLKNQTNKLPA